MTEQKRPVLSLRRRESGDSQDTPVRSRKTIVNVTAPPKWKVKKQQLAEKAEQENERAEKQAQAEQALKGYLHRQPLEEAVSILQPWWPALFDGQTPRLLACGIREVLFRDVETRSIPLSHKKIIRALKAITCHEGYLTSMQEGACRYTPQGHVAGHVTQEDAEYAVQKLARIVRQNKRKAELMAVLKPNDID
ncbi:fertility inhibition protein FinO [Salmonella enterica]|uniref:fertility inhibition protein FinO n=1 Tax=Salmonella enterica TaxID=28901 RepID=UPI001DCCBA0F|nr:fertility inhibition protein FinO [Salmonella enterica]EEA7832909.1 fertility inhibition protein FinO [Salmonella enterica subsp. enterica serovar Panama]EID6351895.1 fertility inhibition protein FinO [Salmonella enterica]MCT7051201.1 fertility inhibition protein FinO [Salmonella enterica subsp. enterica serovar Give]